MKTNGWGERLNQAQQRLPRDARDTLLLLAVISCTMAPHAFHLPLWCTALSVVVLAWRARLALTSGALPGRWVVTGLLMLAAGLTLWSERTVLGREAGVTMLVALMALKTLELRARRDALVVFFLGFFLVLTNFLYSQSLFTGLWMLVALWGLLTALVLAHMPVGRPPLWRAGAIAARAAALGVPLMVLLFVLFPRMGPLWGLPQDAGGRTGLSGSLRMGLMAQMAEDDAIALRLRFEGEVPPTGQLYFRGPVLAQFNGQDWTRLVPSVPAAQRARAELAVRGAGLRYEMTVEPSKLPLLPLLEATPDTAETAPSLPGWLLTLRPDLQWQTERPVAERVRLKATAYLDHQHGPLRPVAGLQDYLLLPDGYNPRLPDWTREFVAQRGLARADTLARVQAVLNHIREGGFTYTLEPGSYGREAVDEFWLDRKRGFCEHFSASFVVIMRLMGVPARIVTGYQGVDALPQDGYWVVRQRNAHAWAEVWAAGRGWVRVDPTAAVAPDRVERGRSLSPAPSLMAQAIGNIDPQLLVKWRQGWETLNNRWNQWVLNYSSVQQLDLLRSWGFSSPNWTDLATTLIVILCAVALAGAAWAWWDRRRQDPWLRLLGRIQRRLAQLGVTVAAHDPLLRRAALVRQALGERGHALANTLDDLAQARYGAAITPSAAARASGSNGSKGSKGSHGSHGFSRLPSSVRPWWRRFEQAASLARSAANAAQAHQAPYEPNAPAVPNTGNAPSA
jgi:protein-glutamine gamma-glutamyltransferase